MDNAKQMFAPSRRSVLRSLSAGSILLPGILQQLLAADARGATSPSSSTAGNPLAPRQPYYAPKAKRVIFLYMSGGVSHMDSFDPKPKLVELGGKPPGKGGRPYVRPLWDF